MEFSYQQQEDSKSSSEETDRSSERNDDTGTGRSYECVFCKRGFTTAQALGGHMNIHRKDRANNKAKQNFHPSSSSKVDDIENYADLGFCSPSPSHHVAGGNPYSHDQVDTDNYYRQIYFPSPPPFGVGPNSHVQYSEVHQGQQFGSQDWRQRNSSLYTNLLCVRENKDKIQDDSEENGLDLELRLGHHP